MILKSLASYYERKAALPGSGLPLWGFTVAKVHFSLVLDRAGQLVQVVDLRNREGSRIIPRQLTVPQDIGKRSSQVLPSFLWGNSSYVLGADEKGKPDKTTDCHESFKQFHHDILGSSSDTGAKALLRFLETWSPDHITSHQYWEDISKGFLVFQIDGELRFLHEHESVRDDWVRYFDEKKSASRQGTSLISGQRSAIARLHPPIKGVSGAQTSGADLVSFNLTAFESYGKEQGYNAPVSETEAFGYTAALNHLLAGRTNCIRISDLSVVFWTERDSPIEGIFGLVLNPGDDVGLDSKLRALLDSIRQGLLPHDIDGENRFYILGLSPNTKRLSVRFWHVSSAASIVDNLATHFRDLSIQRQYPDDPKFPPLGQILRESCNQKSRESEPPPLLGGALLQAILTGGLYPQILLSLVIGRIRADQDVRYLRAAILKAVLNRKHRILGQGGEIPMTLDPESKQPAYLLGRLFAVLEKAQQDAIPGANTTIKDRFYGSASATPRVVFPQLLRLAQYHIGKAEYGRVRDRQIEEVLTHLREFPAHLGLDEQGLFAIGYYQQRQEIWKKKTEKPQESGKES